MDKHQHFERNPAATVECARHTQGRETACNAMYDTRAARAGERRVAHAYVFPKQWPRRLEPKCHVERRMKDTHTCFQQCGTAIHTHVSNSVVQQCMCKERTVRERTIPMQHMYIRDAREGRLNEAVCMYTTTLLLGVSRSAGTCTPDNTYRLELQATELYTSPFATICAGSTNCTGSKRGGALSAYALA